jgi:hypothetical protein
MTLAESAHVSDDPPPGRPGYIAAGRRSDYTTCPRMRRYHVQLHHTLPRSHTCVVHEPPRPLLNHTLRSPLNTVHLIRAIVPRDSLTYPLLQIIQLRLPPAPIRTRPAPLLPRPRPRRVLWLVPRTRLGSLVGRYAPHTGFRAVDTDWSSGVAFLRGSHYSTLISRTPSGSKRPHRLTFTPPLQADRRRLESQVDRSPARRAKYHLK